MAKRSIIVVGNGLFGSMAATLARNRGHEVTVIADGRMYAGSAASGCVMAPSWWPTALGKETLREANSVLADLYPVKSIEFAAGAMGMTKTFKATHVDPSKVLLKPDLKAKVTAVTDGVVQLMDGQKLKGVVLVAAGVWTGELLTDLPPITPLWGASLRFKAQIAYPRIRVYAPYRQAVAFNISKTEVWMGDGTSLGQATWNKEREVRVANTQDRAASLFGLDGPNTAIVGARPYMAGHKGGYFERVTPRLYVSTGGAKNGTVLAAWQALRFVRNIEGR